MYIPANLNIFKVNLEINLVARIFIFIGLILCPIFSYSQHVDDFIVSVSEEGKQVIDNLDLESELEKLNNARQLRDFMNSLYEHGYLLASYDIQQVGDSPLLIDLKIGQVFHWINLNNGNMIKDFGRRAGIRLDQYEDKEVIYSEVSALFNKILDYAEHTGYPFATIQLEALSIDMNRKSLAASLNYLPGPQIIFDSLVLENTRTRSSFLAAYLGFRKGDPYDQEIIDLIDKKISRLGYLDIEETPKINFNDSTYTINLSLQDRPSSNFNGLVGVFPNENESGKVLITGMVYLGLKNLFNSGKAFEFDWSKPNIQMQELSIDYTHPNLFRSAIGLSAYFNLFKQDTTFLNREGKLKFDFQGIGNGSFGIQASILASTVLTNNQSESMDNFADYSISYYGLHYELSDYDDWIFPRKGWDMVGTINIGSKNITGTDLNDNIDSSTGNLQSTLIFTIGKYFPINKRSTILSRFSGGHITNSNLLWNELYRLGGLNSIRGFNEKFFFTSSYAYINFEYRLFFGNESQMIFFYDQGLLHNILQGDVQLDYPSGLGAGFNLKTNFGILTLLYALGSSNEQPFGLDYSKIHMGYTSRF